jgi:hypothetical protein
MPSEKLASGENLLKGELAAAWNILEGSSGDYTDLGIARRFGGAAAAYSLRDIGAMNGPVVNVRREPHDDDDPGVADETDFSAHQVQSGVLEDWVNGKLESTLPADVATAAAAYSLRKVKASYSGDAVRIRRSSDNIEVDVAFDSDGKVSASSPITDGGTELTPDPDADLGSTTATTLGDFISYRDNIIGNSEFNTAANLGFDDGSSACPLWTKAGSGAGSATFTSNTTETTDPNGGNTAAKFQWSASGTNWLRQETELAAGVEVTFSAYYKQLGSQTTVRHNYWSGSSDKNVVLDFSNGTISEAPSGGSAPTSSAVQNVGNGWYRVSMVLTTVAGTTENKAQPARQPASVTGGGVYVWGAMLEVGNTLGTYVKTTSEIPNGVAFVHTWYDQAGVNNAVQATAANQPKIAENGALLADGIDFDGSNDNLLLGDICDNINNFSAFMFAKSDGTTGATQICWSQGSSGDSNIFYQGRNDANVLFGYAAAANTTTSTVSQFQNGFLFTSIAGSSTAKSFGNAVESASVSSSSSNPSSSSNTIGSHFSANYFDGTIKELIFYTSDQSANRFKIESNINNYYGLYNDANEFSGNPVAAGGASAAITLTNVSKTGFTAEISTTSGTKQINFPLLNSLVSGDDYFVSFDYTSTSTSTVGVKPRTALLGSASNDVIAATNSRFYSGTGDSQHNGFDVNNTATVLSFQTTAQSFTFTVSNLRVSRIARNGFVETWYDQSGNANNATQASANNQPKIVVNGGIMTLENGTPSLGFNRSGGLSHFALSSGISNEPYTFFATTVHNGLHYFRIFAEGNNAPSIILNSGSGGSIVYYPSDSDNSGTLSTTAIFSDNIVSGFSGVNGGADGIVRINGTNLKTDISRTQAADSITQIGRFPNTSAEFSNIESLVIYESDLSADFDTIEKELAQPINIL